MERINTGGNANLWVEMNRSETRERTLSFFCDVLFMFAF